MIQLESAHLSVLVDPDHGAEIVSITHAPSSEDLLFKTPWRAQADYSLQTGISPVSTTSHAAWLGTYRGGWQLLVPNAGPEKVRDGAVHAFHGEASTAAWRLVDANASEVFLTIELTSAPLRIERRIVVVGDSVRIEDEVRNLSGSPVSFDYVQHPAFGGLFLDEGAWIETGASGFVPDPDSKDDGECAPESVDPARVTVPAGDSPELFGYLTDFTDYWAEIHSISMGLTVRLTWDGEVMPHAWLWRELGSTRAWPWFGRARVVAVEPASTPTSGPGRHETVLLEPNGSRKTWIAVAVEVSP